MVNDPNNPNNFIASSENPDGSVTLDSKLRLETDQFYRRIDLDASESQNWDKPHTINGNFDVNGPANINGSPTQPNIINGGFSRTKVTFGSTPGLIDPVTGKDSYGQVIGTNNFLQILKGGAGPDVFNADQMSPVLNESVQSSLVVTADGKFQARIPNGDQHLIYARGGNDVANGGAYNDTIYGAEGADTLNGGAGNDVLYGNGDASGAADSFGPDVLNGEAGEDTLHGAANGAIMKGGSANDRLYSGGGNTTMDGGDGNDDITGMSGSKDTVIMSRSGPDWLGNTIDRVSLQKEDAFIVPKLPEGYTSPRIELDGISMIDPNRLGSFTAQWYGNNSNGVRELLGSSFVTASQIGDAPQIGITLSNGDVRTVTPKEIFDSPNRVFSFEEQQSGDVSPNIAKPAGGTRARE
jgi:Ca2+-binding RTX toxin-like protein